MYWLVLVAVLAMPGLLDAGFKKYPDPGDLKEWSWVVEPRAGSGLYAPVDMFLDASGILVPHGREVNGIRATSFLILGVGLFAGVLAFLYFLLRGLLRGFPAAFRRFISS
jgi:hypothetical protein